MKYELEQFENDQFFDEHNVGMIFCDGDYTLDELDSGQYLISKHEEPMFILSDRSVAENKYFEIVDEDF